LVASSNSSKLLLSNSVHCVEAEEGVSVPSPVAVLIQKPVVPSTA